MTRLRSFKHVFSTTSVREGLSVCLSVWAKTCFQRGRSFPFLETAGVVRSKHVNLLDSHRPIISASPDFKSRVCRALPSDARKSPAPSVRSLARGAETPRGSPSRVRRVLASNLDPSDPSRGATTMSARGSPPDAAGSHRHPAGAGASARGSQRDSVPMVRTSAPHRAGSPKTRAGDGDSHPTEHETRHAR